MHFDDEDQDLSPEEEAELERQYELIQKSKEWITTDEAEKLRDEIGRLVGTYISRQYEIAEIEDKPYVVCWALALEYTTIDLERSGHADRSVITANGQSVSATSGLGHYLAKMFT
jgi:hypothetical protein